VAPIKAKLKGLSATELVTLVRDLYQASPENRQFCEEGSCDRRGSGEVSEPRDRRGVPRPAQPKPGPPW